METEWAGIFCAGNTIENFFHLPNVRYFSKRSLSLGTELKFKDFVSILSSTSAQGMTSDKLFQGGL